MPAERLHSKMSAAARSPELADTRGLAEFASRLDLPRHRSILTQQLLEPDDNGPMAMVATLYLAIVTRRVPAGRQAELQSAQLPSLIDHPVAAAHARIRHAVDKDAKP